MIVEFYCFCCFDCGVFGDVDEILFEIGVEIYECMVFIEVL